MFYIIYLIDVDLHQLDEERVRLEYFMFHMNMTYIN